MKKVGLLGGSFNPAHAGHRRISLYAMRALGLDEVWWLVSPGNPLKQEVTDMAPLRSRLASARKVARNSRIIPTAIESVLGTRYTVDTLRALRRRYPKKAFIWIMGADNLAQFHQWRDWRGIARRMPIAVMVRPGYDRKARFAPVMGWFGRFVRRPSHKENWTKWRLPSLVMIGTRPDTRSATALRARFPDWHRPFAHRSLRDEITHDLI